MYGDQGRVHWISHIYTPISKTQSCKCVWWPLLANPGSIPRFSGGQCLLQGDFPCKSLSSTFQTSKRWYQVPKIMVLNSQINWAKLLELFCSSGVSNFNLVHEDFTFCYTHHLISYFHTADSFFIHLKAYIAENNILSEIYQASVFTLSIQATNPNSVRYTTGTMSLHTSRWMSTQRDKTNGLRKALITCPFRSQPDYSCTAVLFLQQDGLFTDKRRTATYPMTPFQLTSLNVPPALFTLILSPKPIKLYARTDPFKPPPLVPSAHWPVNVAMLDTLISLLSSPNYGIWSQHKFPPCFAYYMYYFFQSSSILDFLPTPSTIFPFQIFGKNGHSWHVGICPKFYRDTESVSLIHVMWEYKPTTAWVFRQLTICGVPHHNQQ